MPNDLEKRIIALEEVIDGLRNEGQLEPEIAITLGLSIQEASGKTVASETQAVDEGGISTYNVQKVPDKYIKIGDVHVPAYTS